MMVSEFTSQQSFLFYFRQCGGLADEAVTRVESVLGAASPDEFRVACRAFERFLVHLNVASADDGSTIEGCRAKIVETMKSREVTLDQVSAVTTSLVHTDPSAIRGEMWAPESATAACLSWAMEMKPATVLLQKSPSSLVATLLTRLACCDKEDAGSLVDMAVNWISNGLLASHDIGTMHYSRLCVRSMLAARVRMFTSAEFGDRERCVLKAVGTILDRPQASFLSADVLRPELQTELDNIEKISMHADTANVLDALRLSPCMLEKLGPIENAASCGEMLDLACIADLLNDTTNKALLSTCTAWMYNDDERGDGGDTDDARLGVLWMGIERRLLHAFPIFMRVVQQSLASFNPAVVTAVLDYICSACRGDFRGGFLNGLVRKTVAIARTCASRSFAAMRLKRVEDPWDSSCDDLAKSLPLSLVHCIACTIVDPYRLISIFASRKDASPESVASSRIIAPWNAAAVVRLAHADGDLFDSSVKKLMPKWVSSWNSSMNRIMAEKSISFLVAAGMLSQDISSWFQEVFMGDSPPTSAHTLAHAESQFKSRASTVVQAFAHSMDAGQTMVDGLLRRDKVSWRIILGLLMHRRVASLQDDIILSARILNALVEWKVDGYRNVVKLLEPPPPSICEVRPGVDPYNPLDAAALKQFLRCQDSEGRMLKRPANYVALMQLILRSAMLCNNEFAVHSICKKLAKHAHMLPKAPIMHALKRLIETHGNASSRTVIISDFGLTAGQVLHSATQVAIAIDQPRGSIAWQNILKDTSHVKCITPERDSLLRAVLSMVRAAHGPEVFLPQMTNLRLAWANARLVNSASILLDSWRSELRRQTPHAPFSKLVSKSKTLENGRDLFMLWLSWECAYDSEAHPEFLLNVAHAFCRHTFDNEKDKMLAAALAAFLSCENKSKMRRVAVVVLNMHGAEGWLLHILETLPPSLEGDVENLLHLISVEAVLSRALFSNPEVTTEILGKLRGSVAQSWFLDGVHASESDAHKRAKEEAMKRIDKLSRGLFRASSIAGKRKHFS